MTDHSLSYTKTAAIAGAMALGALVAISLAIRGVHGPLTALLEGLGCLFCLSTATVALGGLIVIHRDHVQGSGRMDLFLASNNARSADAVATARPGLGLALRRAVRNLAGGQWPLVGDAVEIRSLNEIEQTLDDAACLDGLPFMPEMAGLCGQRARIFRVVDKVYDYGRSKTLRRIKDVVLLAGLRCDGHAHGGCQAGCYLLWKTAWLRSGARAGAQRRGPEPGATEPVTGRMRQPNPVTGRYVCQYTNLAAASTPMANWDVRQELRPLLAGNVTLRAFWVAVLTRLFNVVQRLRGGATYPAQSAAPGARSTAITHDLRPGDTVEVLTAAEIRATLDKTGRNRGLWFDREMIKHCGQRHTVLKRVDRIIDDATGQMVVMKTSCLILAGVDASGEFLRFNAQHEYPFWREAWLQSERRAPSESRVAPRLA
jgi:hypothetical protein